MVDSESIVQIATSIAKRMGVNVCEFEKELRLSVLKFKPLSNEFESKKVGTVCVEYPNKCSESNGDVSCVCVTGTANVIFKNKKAEVAQVQLPNNENHYNKIESSCLHESSNNENHCSKKNIQKQLVDNADNCKSRTYTLEFLRALMESDEFKVIPKVGTEAPRSNSSPTPYHHPPKGKYKPHIISDVDRTKSASVRNTNDNAIETITRNGVHAHHFANTGEYYIKQGFDKDEGTYTSRDIVRSKNITPPPTPTRGENAWIPTKVKREDDPVKLKFNKIRSDLNKISPDNELIIADRICDEIIEECVADLIPVFFDKGVWEQKYREIYVRLCVKLNAKFPGVFLTALLEHTQREFGTKVSEDAEDDEIAYAMKRRIGAAYFIIEMLKVKLVKPAIVVLCAEKMLGSKEEKSDYDICHVAELVIIAIPIIKNKDIIGKLRALIDILENLYLSQYVSQRAKFKVEDAVKVFKK